MLDLHRLRLLRELRRRGTITAVAQAFSFSPSAVSQQLVTLERETGVRLLEQMERAEGALARSTHETSGTLARLPEADRTDLLDDEPSRTCVTPART